MHAIQEYLVFYLHTFLVMYLFVLCEGYTYAQAHVWKSQDNLQESVHSFHHVSLQRESNSCASSAVYTLMH